MKTEAIKCIEELLPILDQYLSQNKELPENWIAGFGNLLNESCREDCSEGHNDIEHSEILIGMQVISISNIMKKRMNRFVSESDFSTFMDFQFLYILNEHGKMTKSILISFNDMEMSSGIEVIKRLIKNQWIIEETNPNDKRSKLIEITELGTHIVSKYEKEAFSFYSSFSTKLSRTRKKNVLDSLTVLNESNK